MFKSLLLFFLALIYSSILSSFSFSNGSTDKDEKGYNMTSVRKSMTTFSMTDMQAIQLGKDDHDHPSILQRLFERITSRLEKLRKEEYNINFNKPIFVNGLYEMLSSSRDESILKDESFWSDLSLFLREWIKHIDCENTRSITKEALDNAKSLIGMINKEYPNSQSVLDHLSINTSISQATWDRARNDIRFRKMANHLQDEMPIPLIELLGNYIPSRHEEAINEILNRLLNDLEIPEEERYKLDLYSDSFMAWFLEKIQKRQRFHTHHQFWNDLKRFMFKWVLAMRKLFADNDKSFESSIVNAKSVMVLLFYRDGFDNQLLSDRPFDLSIFYRLMKHESLDNLQLLERFIKDIFPDLCHNLVLKDITLKQLRERHFNNKSLNSEPLLKLMIFGFTPSYRKDQVKNRFFPGEILNFHDYFDYTFVIDMSELYSGKGSTFNVSGIESLSVNYTSLETIEFFRNHNLGIRISNPSDLINLLKRLDRIGIFSPFKRDILMEKIIKFRLKDGKWKWSADKYKEYLTRLKNTRISQDEYDFYLSIIEPSK
jgi:hypothetical protein